MYKEISMFLEYLSKDEACLIALKVFFDKVFSGKDQKERCMVNVYGTIGESIERECQMRYYRDKNPELYQFIVKKYWHGSMGTRQKSVTTQTLINRKEDAFKWQSWPMQTRTKIGGWYADAICSITNWFQVKRLHKSSNIFEPTALFIKYQDEIMQQAELFSPVKLPMLTEPNDWGCDGTRGGYYTNELTRNCPLVRGLIGSKGLLLQGKQPIEFINRIQKIPFTLNQFICDVAEHCWKHGIEIKKFRPIKQPVQVTKPIDIETNDEARKEYRRKRAEVENKHRVYLKKTVRTRFTLEVMRMFRKEKKFYFPWSFDYRGRAYPIPSYLTPQDSDFGKSLITFYEAAFITPEAEDWLAFQVATTYGLDKSPMHERLQWARDNHSLIHAIASDPTGTIPQWEVADEPWQFLAACEEYNACLIECSRHHTRLPIAVDASCSGIQILSGLARDKAAAELVNVTPSDHVQDAYAVIAELAKPNVPESFHRLWDRKIVKKVVMTMPYNSKPYSNKDYIRQAIEDKDESFKFEPGDINKAAKAVRDAMNKRIPGPMQVMAWIEKEVGKAFKRGEKILTWTTPSGFLVHQEIPIYSSTKVKTILFGETKNVYVGKPTDDPNVKKHKSATAPNLIHSLDASLLHLTVLRWDAPIALIHDSVLCRATDMSSLNTIIRETYKHLFAENDFLTDFAKQIGAETEPPIIGDLKPENVMASTYFFS
jgi:DNA-directed RNA polymerase